MLDVTSLDATSLESQFEKLAESLTYLDTLGIGEGRTSSWNNTIPDDELETHSRTIDYLAKSQFAGASFETIAAKTSPILEHKDAKVRTLAMVWLYQTEDPRVLDLLYPHLQDSSLTFPKPSPTTMSRLPDDFVRRTPEVKQTVSEVAEYLLDSILSASYGNFPLDTHPEQALEQYWSTRRNRAHCLGWFRFRAGRAVQEEDQFSGEVTRRLSDIASSILRLPALEREIYYLAIFADLDLRNDYVEDELLHSARRLGPARLMALVRGEPLIDDPDLPLAFPKIQQYVFENPEEFLGSEYADDVLEFATQSSRIDAYLAAASLAPQNASSILRTAIDSNPEWTKGYSRARLMVGLWRIVGESETEYVLDWFFSDRTEGEGISHHRTALVDFLLKRFNLADRKLLSQLIRDTRFDSEDLLTHLRILEGLNRNLLHPVVDIKPSDISAQLRVDNFDPQIPLARAGYPEKREQLLDKLKSWRAELRRSISSWETR